VQTKSGVVVGMKNIVRMHPMEKDFWSWTSGVVELRFSLTSPSDVPTNYAFDGEGKHRRESWMTDIYLNSLLDRNNGKNRVPGQLFKLRCAPLAGTALVRHGLF